MKQQFGFSRRAKLLAVVLCAALAIVIVGVALAADVPHIFDHFDSVAQSITVIFSGPTSASNSAGTGDPLIMGGERDLALYATGGSGRIDLLAHDPDLYPSELVYIASPGERGYAVVKWDGENNDPLTLNPIGLRGVNPTGIDITNGGLYTGVDFVVTNEDLNASVVITIYTDALNYMVFTQPTAGNTILPTPYYIPFTNFTTTGTPDVTNVGAVVMTINGTTAPGLDMVFHVVEANGFDLGDLPAAYNLTTLANDGARHLVGDLYLGSEIDVEPDGNPSANATGDDTTGSVPDDEDGVTVVGTSGTAWVDGPNGGAVSVNVTGGTGCLSAGIDWDGNNSLAGADDFVINSVLVSSSTNPNVISFTVPAGTFNGVLPNKVFNARFRLAPDSLSDNDCTPVSLGGLEPDPSPTGLIYNGEVEDYQWTFTPTAVTLNKLEAKADTQNNTAVLILAGAVLTLGVVVVAIRRRRIA